MTAEFVKTGSAKRVLIVQRRLTHYRVPFFEALQAELEARGIELTLAHGDGTRAEKEKHDERKMAGAHRLATRYLFGGKICWQPFFGASRDVDLMILTHESKLVCNLWAQYAMRNVRVALWGHGANLQGRKSSWRERFKRRTAVQADWWFGYTELSRPLIGQSGFPANRITVVDNAIDTDALRDLHAGVGPEDLHKLREELGVVGTRVGIFLGSLYTEKRIDFLLEAATQLRRRIPDFELLVAGAGPDSSRVKEICRENPWVHYVGPVSGVRKAQVLALSDVMLNPGLVGLGILDSFVCRVPLITTDCGIHSPEIAYLESGKNGVMTPDVMSRYVDEAVRVLQDDEYRLALVSGCSSSASRFTIGHMARKFADGIETSLMSPIRRGVA